MAYTTINKSTDYFNTKTYSGSGSAQNIVTGTFQPDLIWVKSRSNSVSHVLTDAVRGIGKQLFSDTTGAETSWTNALTAFRSDGFTTDTGGETGQSGRTYVSWNWKANGTGSANTDGTAANVTVSANQTAGFSIVQFDATQSRVSVGHGLGSTPDAIFMKETEAAGGWVVGGFGLDWSGYLSLQSNNAFNNDSNDSSGTGRMFTPDGYAPTSSVWSTNGSAFLSGGTKTCIAYCFKSIKGYSKFGSYVGNGSSSSPTFIYTGFKPKFVMVKNTSQADSWFIHDDKRDGYNDDNEYLFADLSNAEGSNVNRIRLLSNGFSVPTTDKSHNVSGNSYIYMAFGQSLVGSNNVPCTAR